MHVSLHIEHINTSHVDSSYMYWKMLFWKVQQSYFNTTDISVRSQLHKHDICWQLPNRYTNTRNLLKIMNKIPPIIIFSFWNWTLPMQGDRLSLKCQVSFPPIIQRNLDKDESTYNCNSCQRTSSRWPEAGQLIRRSTSRSSPLVFRPSWVVTAAR